MPYLPDVPGVYVLTCRFMGSTSRTLGEVLYVGMATSLRRRVAYALGSAGKGKTILHGVQVPLREFQEAGGQVDVLYAVVDRAEDLAGIEAALVQEHMHRAGARPAWNRATPRIKPSAEALAVAEKILDALRIGPR